MYDPDFKPMMKAVLVGDAIGSEKIYPMTTRSNTPIFYKWE
jgi:hypothetical protein